MNILFTCVGRRVELIQAFRAAADNLAIRLRIYGSDTDINAPAAFFCDQYIQSCIIIEPQYIKTLVQICKNEQVDAVIPTIDTDLIILSESKDLFLEVGTRVIVSDIDTILLCRDKSKTVDFIHSCGLLAPNAVDDMMEYSGKLPCFIKPKDGSSSINAFRIDKKEDLVLYTTKINDYLIQPYIKGKEYTVDILCDFEGNPIHITPRERLRIRSGEVIQTIIVQDERIVEECKIILSAIQFIGAITIQLIREEITGNDYFIEINPRFGGGAPLSMKAGADSACSLLRILNGETIVYQSEVNTGEIYSRYDQSIRIRSCDLKIEAVVFDLDDTLYSEKDYIRSGFCAVACYLHIDSAEKKLWASFIRKEPAIDALLIEEGIYTDKLKEECIHLYREHKPSIRLYDGVEQMLIGLREQGVKIGLLTDGRSEGQRAKIKVLHLTEYVDEIIVTDELGGIQFRKPNDVAFRVIQRRFGIPFERMGYIGDNAVKDFLAPLSLGMSCIHVNNSDGLYHRTADCRVKSLDNIIDVMKILRGRGITDTSQISDAVY
ncbi:hypothetical protein AGMMS49992_32490 [Clostridia bacterium]|nr:hypothetical protein AGMMS49992_32490 [Clostridia bacterium]